MAKKITKKLKLVIPAGKANPAPPIGPALGQAGINIGEFVKQFNDATKTMIGDIVPVDISVYEDRNIHRHNVPNHGFGSVVELFDKLPNINTGLTKGRTNRWSRICLARRYNEL